MHCYLVGKESTADLAIITDIKHGKYSYIQADFMNSTVQELSWMLPHISHQ